MRPGHVHQTAEDSRRLEVVCPLPGHDIAPLIAGHAESSWAVDVPFGWPDAFVELMRLRHQERLPGEAVPDEAGWDAWRTREVAQRRTDRFLTDDPRIHIRPLPASFQMLGATAALWVLIEARLVGAGVIIDRAGVQGRVCETTPGLPWSAGVPQARASWTGLGCGVTSGS